MTATGITADGIPASFAEDGPAREAIVGAVIAKASVEYQSEFEQTVFVGDATLDMRTAQRLGLRFVGVGSGEQAAMLRNAGATLVIENFLNHEYCMECFEGAAIPKLHSISRYG